MPTLEWIGKEKVINHDKEVPFKMLDAQYTFDETGRRDGAANSGNLIIHGDNLLALKALLPKYQGKVKCIYIDPPYNTGNEGWVYNDKVSDPQIKKWLGEVVGKEGEDLSRHDKWLCMMYPRLKLLQQLLADDGAIFISIGDEEVVNLRLMCNEIFGESNFFAQIVVQANKRGQTYKQIAKTHEYILVFTKTQSTTFNELNKSDNDLTLSDNVGNFSIRELRNRNPKFGRFNRPNLFYPIYVNPNVIDKDGFSPVSLQKSQDYSKEVLPYNSKGIESCWRWGSKLTSENYSENTLNSNLVAKKKNDGSFNIYEKYRKETVKAKTIWFETEMITEHGTVQLREIGLGAEFPFPKPVELVHKCLELGTDKESIVLDSFAGSGTTAHAVLSLNQKDNGNRKFILVEMMDYADSITAERVKRVIRGYGEGDKATPGTGGSFTYYELGETLFDDEGNLNASIPEEKIREYVWYMETKLPLPVRTTEKAESIPGKTGNAGETKREKRSATANDNAAFLGVCNHTAYYFHYDADSATTLDHDFLASVKTEAESYVIYADACALSEEFLSKHHITFKKIPRDIERL